METKNRESPEIIAFIDNVSKLSGLMKKLYSKKHLRLRGERYLDNKEVCKMLHISPRTLHHYRDSGKIAYIHITGKILYKESDVLKLIDGNRTEAITFQGWY